MNKLIKATGNTVEPYWPILFAKALEGKNINDLISNVGTAVAATGVAEAAPSEVKGKNDNY